MRCWSPMVLHAARRSMAPALVLILMAALCTSLPAQAVNPFVGSAVGGVSIDADGLLQNAQLDALGKLRQLRAEALQQIPADLSGRVPLRNISLRSLEAAIQECSEQGQPLPDAITYLAGLQQIRYVLVYPEQQDIVLVGPAEGWKVSPQGTIVGQSTGRPVMLLDDLLVALRTAQQAARGGISCSIEPSEEGLARLRQQLSTVRTAGDPQQTAAGMEQALGPQRILVQGVPATSHFARVLVAADYRMKRIAMNFEQPPAGVKLSSFLRMVPASGRGMSNVQPRWWLEPKYEPLLRDEEGLAWELRGASVKALAEEDFLTAAGQREHTGKASPVAQQWAKQMTDSYAALSVADPIFGELQNCMELAIVAALVVKERLPEKSGHSLALMMDPTVVKTQEYNAPKQVATKASLMKKGRNWVFAASGGVAVPSWSIADKVEKGAAPAAARQKAAPAANGRWWWN